MTCDEAREATLDRAAAPLEPEVAKDLEAHLARCAACREHAREIAELEDQITDTLASVASTDVSKRFKPRSRWAPLAAAAAVVLAGVVGYSVAQPHVARVGARLEGKGVFALERGEVSLAPGARALVEETGVRLEAGRARFRVEGPFAVMTSQGTVKALGTEFTVEVGEERMRNTTTLGASIVVVGVVSGAVYLHMNDGQEVTVKAGETAVGRADAPIAVLTPVEAAKKQADAEKKIQELQLASAKAHAAELVKELAAVTSAASAERPAASPAPSAGPAATQAPTTAEEKVRELVKSFDWKSATKALATFQRAASRGTSQNIDPSVYMALSQMNVLAGQIAKERGFSNPWQAYSDPVVAASFLPSYLDAMGANLDANQAEAVRARSSMSAHAESGDQPPAAGYLGSLKDQLDGQLKFQQFLGTLLRPDQAQSYSDFVGDDPYFGLRLDRSVNRSTTLDGLVDNVLGDWKHVFELSDASIAAAQALARKYVDGAVSIAEVDPSLDVAARRTAGMQRAISVVSLQQGIEAELAALPALTDAERERVQQGSHHVLELQIKK
jgi:ferric-dicitrate binding protein FerR (iron transport regulator)